MSYTVIQNNELILNRCKYRMIEKTAGLGLAAVTAIMCGVGVMMFLLPPVPGVPVYLALGIVLPAQGHEILGKR